MKEEARISSLKGESLLSILRALVEDTEEIVGLGRNTLMGDFERVALSSRSRGFERTVLLDLPALCSDFEQALERGHWEPIQGKPFTKKGYPQIFLPLLLRIFDENWVLLGSHDVCVESIRCFRQLTRAFKKFRVDPPTSSITEKIDEFILIEQTLPIPSLSWGNSSLRVRAGWPSLPDLGRNFSARSVGWNLASGGDFGLGEAPEIFRALSYIQSVADRTMRSFHFRGESFEPKHGPGAVADQYRESKYEFPTWPARLEAFFPVSEYGIANYGFYEEITSIDTEEAAKLIPVPKDFKGPRLIASEPISSQYIQQGLMKVLRASVRDSILHHCIDFTSQEPSRLKVLEASCSGDYSTIDLSSASDRLSCAVVECIFRRSYHLLEMFNAARTPKINIGDGRVLAAKKFAAQGAAFTFPVQSIVYALICMGCIYSRSDPRTRLADVARQVRVFGDDMIVPTEHFPLICQVLEALDLKVNRSKSFSRGFFKESCGCDAYLGHDVTPANILATFSQRDPLSTVSVIECSNNLYKKGFIRAALTLQETIPAAVRKDIPFVVCGSTFQGFHGSCVSKHKRRWNKWLHRHEVKVLVVETKVSKTNPEGHHRLFQWLREKPKPDLLWTGGEVVGAKARYRLKWVPEQLLRAAL